MRGTYPEIRGTYSDLLRPGPSGYFAYRPSSDDTLDDNDDDNPCSSDVDYRAFLVTSCLFRVRACSWQCGGQGFESP